MSVCSACGQALPRQRDSSPYDLLRDPAWLAQAYEQQSAQAIAQKLGVNSKTVLSWMHKHGIATRSHAEEQRDVASRDQRRADCIRWLREWSRDNDDRTPTAAEWEANRPVGAPGEKPLRELFGSWGSACEAAGLRRRSRGEVHDLREQRQERRLQATRDLQQWAAENEDSSPGQLEWDATKPDHALSAGRICALFGSWNAALRAAGLPVRKPGQNKRGWQATAAGEKPGRNRQMVTGAGLNDRLAGTVKHFGIGART